MSGLPAPSISPDPRTFAPRPLAAAVLVSVCAHVALLALTATARVATLPTIDIIRITLRPGQAGASGGPAGPAAPPAAAPSTVAALAAPPVPPPPAAVPQHPVIAPAPKPAARHTRPTPRAAAAPSPAPAMVDEGAAPPGASPRTDVASTGPAGGGAAGGTGSAGGGGTGNGPGGGSGGTDVGDQRASCIYCPEPIYPLVARRRGWQGTVDVGLMLLADGRVASASVRRSSGFEALDKEALEVARRSRFRLPPTTGGPVQGQIKYRFELVGTN